MPLASAATSVPATTTMPEASNVSRRGQLSTNRPSNGESNPPASVIDSATPIVASETSSPLAMVARNGGVYRYAAFSTVRASVSAVTRARTSGA